MTVFYVRFGTEASTSNVGQAKDSHPLCCPGRAPPPATTVGRHPTTAATTDQQQPEFQHGRGLSRIWVICEYWWNNEHFVCGTILFWHTSFYSDYFDAHLLFMWVMWQLNMYMLLSMFYAGRLFDHQSMLPCDSFVMFFLTSWQGSNTKSPFSSLLIGFSTIVHSIYEELERKTS